MTALTYTFDELRAALQLRSARTMARRLKQLEAHGFPPRLPGGSALWPRAAVDAWLASWGSAPPAATPTPRQPKDAFGFRPN